MSWLPLKDVGIYPTPVPMALYESHDDYKYIHWKKEKTHSKHTKEYTKRTQQTDDEYCYSIVFFSSIFQHVIKWTVFNYIIVIIYR